MGGWSSKTRLSAEDMQFLQTKTQLDQASHDPHGVQLSTVHRVKGREWPEVVVFEAESVVLVERRGPG